MDIKTFVNITSKAWALTILSQMHAGVAGRQAPLLAASGASRTAFVQSLDHLIKIKMLERNPGHGHPLRPEYRLTPLGKQAAGIAHQIQGVARPKDGDLLRRAWTVPILTLLHRPSHFNDIKRGLPMITDRALSQSLKSMQDREWVSRNVVDITRPPRSLYSAINLGSEICQITEAEINLHNL